MYREVIGSLISEINKKEVTQDEYGIIIKCINQISKICKEDDVCLVLSINNNSEGLNIEYSKYDYDGIVNRYDVFGFQRFVTSHNFNFAAPVIIITDISVDKKDRGNGIATRELIKFCESNNESFIILNNVINVKNKGNMKINDISIKKQLEKQLKFFKKIGFIDITSNISEPPADVIRQFNQSFDIIAGREILVYNNSMYKLLLNKIEENKKINTGGNSEEN